MRTNTLFDNTKVKLQKWFLAIWLVTSHKRVKQSASVFTDEWLGYNEPQRIFVHSVIKHNANEYVNGYIHTNTIEGFWSLLKRGVMGIYHFTTKKHLIIIRRKIIKI